MRQKNSIHSFSRSVVQFKFVVHSFSTFTDLCNHSPFNHFHSFKFFRILDIGFILHLDHLTAPFLVFVIFILIPSFVAISDQKFSLLFLFAES